MVSGFSSGHHSASKSTHELLQLPIESKTFQRDLYNSGLFSCSELFSTISASVQLVQVVLYHFVNHSLLTRQTFDKKFMPYDNSDCT